MRVLKNSHETSSIDILLHYVTPGINPRVLLAVQMIHHLVRGAAMTLLISSKCLTLDSSQYSLIQSFSWFASESRCFFFRSCLGNNQCHTKLMPPMPSPIEALVDHRQLYLSNYQFNAVVASFRQDFRPYSVALLPYARILITSNFQTTKHEGLGQNAVIMLTSN